MPIPAHNLDGILPPFVGPDPGGPQQDMSPYKATVLEFVDRFSTTLQRCEILEGWLDHRTALRALGIFDGFQWLNGSFVEHKEPRDLDVITFFRRPSTIATLPQLAILNSQPAMQRNAIKSAYNLDAFFVDLNGRPESLVTATRYYGSLFSHRRNDFLWKGMVWVSLNGSDDAAAVRRLRISQQSLTAPNSP